MAAKPVSLAEFTDIIENDFARVLGKAKHIAVGVSGGPDSMALAKLLSLWAVKNKITVHALTIDHDLRKESAKESALTAKRLKDFPAVIHKTLKWTGAKPKTRLMEEAREARYRLISEYCAQHKIKHVFLAHHQDDQAETFLFRLAKGSGLDGLSGIKLTQEQGALILLRPLLGVSKDQLVATCKAHKLSYIKDPSNESARFARPRLRKARKVLEEEGLSSKRLAVTALRLERARNTLENLAEKSFMKNVLTTDTSRIVLSAKAFSRADEVAFRVLLTAVENLRPGEAYMPRMEKLESLFADLTKDSPFRKRTLGGLIFERDDRKKLVTISIEKRAKVG